MTAICKTKIVCTIGPASRDPATLRRLAQAGMDVARLNFSHGTRSEHLQVIGHLRRLEEELHRPIAILQDLTGPKVRVGEIKGERVRLQHGDRFVLTTRPILGDERRVSVNYDRLPLEVERGDPVLLADGAIELEVVTTTPEEIITRVEVGGILGSHKGINLPSRTLSIAGLTAKDKEDLAFGLDHGVDLVALSFVRRPEDLEPPLEIMAKRRRVPLVAKIEKHEAVDNLDAIIDRVDAVMVARGDLGVETPLERVPLLQKLVIKKCNRAGKPVITATQMLGSMVSNPRPTRAEASDVANAVMDGTDALMLSEETAVGRYPVAAVEMMARIAAATEAQLDYDAILAAHGAGRRGKIEAAVGYAACVMARDLEAAAIFAATQSGTTARMISRFRPRAPIYALTPSEATRRVLNLTWGVTSFLCAPFAHTDGIFQQAQELARVHGLAEPGQVLVITAGVPVGRPGSTNMVKASVLQGP